MELREDEQASRRPGRVHADVSTRIRSDLSEMAPEWYLMSGIALPDSLLKERSKIVGKLGCVEL